MLVQIVTNGKRYTIPVSQVVVMTDDGRPVAVSYVEGNTIVHSDATSADFQKVVGEIGVTQKTGPVDVMAG